MRVFYIKYFHLGNFNGMADILLEINWSLEAVKTVQLSPV